MDFSSELVHSLLPVFMTSVLGASMLEVGLVEGLAEAAASIVKVFSGVLSDRLRKRKLLAALGYGLAALSKPLFPLAESIGLVMVARFVDRIGKGIRGAPRDALVADVTPIALRGTAYGLRQALDSVGAVLGPLSGVGLMLLFADNIHTVLWVAVLPAVAAVAVLVLAVREPPLGVARTNSHAPISLRVLRALGARYWGIVALGAVLTLARFSQAFLVLRAKDLGLGLAWVPLVIALMSVTDAAVSYPAGRAVDRGGQRALLVWGLVVLVAADLVLGSAGSIGAVFFGVALWGVHLGLTQGLLATLVSDVAPPAQRGTAFGFFNLVSGAMLLAASVLAGELWEAIGADWTFFAGAAFTAVALIGLVVLTAKHR